MKLDREMEMLLNEIPLLHHGGDVVLGGDVSETGLSLIQELGALRIDEDEQAGKGSSPFTGVAFSDYFDINRPFSCPTNAQFSKLESLIPTITNAFPLRHGSNMQFDPFLESPVDGWDFWCSPGPRTRGKNPRKKAQISIGSAGSPKALKGAVAKYEGLIGLRGFMYHIARDQHGCRLLQQKLDEGKLQVDVIFAGVARHAVELMVNPFGNYLMQKLLCVCDEEQRMGIIVLLTKKPFVLVRISLNVHGTRAVQKLIESLKTRVEISLVIAALRPGFLELIKDPNGNHVMQRCLQTFEADDNKVIFDAAAVHCVDIGTQRHGCCVLQRCIAHSTSEHKEKLVAAISSNGFELAQDAYGNYVVQYVLDLKNPTANESLAQQFEGKYIHLSMQKFSSNVVEKCLKVFKEADKAHIVLELLSVPHFEQLLQHPYANYVIYSALQNSKGWLHTALTTAIRPHVELLRTSPYCKRIYSRALLKK